MYNIQRVDPRNWQQTAQLQELYDNLPRKIRCSTRKDSTIFRAKSGQQSGHTFAYIGYNPPNTTRYIIIDLDYDNAIFAYYDNNAPIPQFIVKNPVNGHCHYIYQLKDPVTFYARSKSAPIRLLTATEQALTELLGGDKGFTGYLAKNALNPAHDTYITGSKPYTLNDLSSNLDLERIENPNEPLNAADYGRNSGTFNTVRVQAYKLASELDYTQLYSECLMLAEQHNSTFVGNMMSYNEVKSIAKSIANYCKSERFQRDFSERQAKRGSKGGKVSKRKPVSTSERTTQPWLELGISRATYYNRKRQNLI